MPPSAAGGMTLFVGAAAGGVNVVVALPIARLIDSLTAIVRAAVSASIFLLGRLQVLQNLGGAVIAHVLCLRGLQLRETARHAIAVRKKR